MTRKPVQWLRAGCNAMQAAQRMRADATRAENPRCARDEWPASRNQRAQRMQGVQETSGPLRAISARRDCKLRNSHCAEVLRRSFDLRRDLAKRLRKDIMHSLCAWACFVHGPALQMGLEPWALDPLAAFMLQPCKIACTVVARRP